MTAPRHPGGFNWPARLTLLLLSAVMLGFLSWLCVQMAQLNARMTASCLAREKLRWQDDPEGMRREQERVQQEDAAIQTELDRLRAASWHGWLTVPKHPRGRGCED
jgi:hypothetical protein